jgi:predicted dehydrogenase
MTHHDTLVVRSMGGDMGMHVGIIGSGFVGRVHLEAMLAHAAVSTVSLAEPDAGSLAKAASELPLGRAESDYRALLDDPGVDIVDICLPHDLHHPVVLEAFAAGKHVIVDKPISNTLPEADEMIAAAEAADRRFFVALNQRFLPVHQRVKQLLDDGSMGREFMATLAVIGDELARMSDPDSWKGTWDRAGGGVLADSGTHVVDLAHDWFGPPTAVTCRLARHVVKTACKADDTGVVMLEYPDLTVTLLLTYGAAGQGWSETRQVWSETGSIHVRLEDVDPIAVWRDGRLLPQEVAHEADWWAWSVKLGLAHALDRLADDRPFAVDPSDAREALRTIRAAYRSAELGQRVLMAEYGGGAR